MSLWNWLFGKEDLTPPKVEFKDRDRVDPTLEMVKAGTTIGQVELRGYDMYRWTQNGWEFVHRMPKASEVKSPSDLPSDAPLSYCYVIEGNTWCWDGACWVVNDHRYNIVFDGKTNHVKPIGSPIKVTPPVRQVTQRRDLGSDLRVSDPHPTDNGALITAVMVSQILDNDYDRPAPTPSGGSTHIGSSSNHSRHDDTPTHHSPSHDTHHTPSSDYGSDFGGSSFD